MILRYYLDDAGRRVYTLSAQDGNENPTFTAHPARFSPDDNSVMSSALYIRDQDIVKAGYLLKQSKYLRQWKQRWIVLSNQYLCSYESQGGHMGSSPTEYLLLRDCTTVKSADEETGREHSFKVESPDRTFYLVASSSAEKEAWIGVVGRQMIRPSVLIGAGEGLNVSR